MRRELIGKTADLPAAHGVRLPGKRERPHAAAADAVGGEMAVDDGIDLVGPLHRLVHPLREQRHHLLGRAEPVEEFSHLGRGDAAKSRDRVDVRGDVACAGEGLGEAARVVADEGAVQNLPFGKLNQKAGEEDAVGARRDLEDEVGVFRGRRATRVDDDNTRAALAPVPHHALMQDWMAPGSVGAGKDEQIGLVEILVTAGHGVGAEGAAVTGHGGGHAQARIGVDVGGAEESLHQLVGDVIVLGEQLSRNVEGDGVRPMALERLAKARGDAVERRVPGHPGQGAIGRKQHRMQQPPVIAQGLAQGRTL